jgi:hypothetical protein
MASGESFADGGPGRCLEPEEMLALASGERPPGPAEHLNRCEQCRRAVEDVAAKVRPRRAVPTAAPPRLQSCAPVSIALAVGMVLGLASVARRQCAPPTAPAAMTPAEAAEPETVPAPARSGPVPSDVTAVFRRNVGTIQTCYNRFLAGNELRRSTRMDLELKVLPDGQVNQIVITSPATAAPALTTCVRTAVRRWRFPPSDERYDLAFPLLLQGH